MKQLAEIKAEVERLASLIEVDATNLPTYGFSEQSGRPNIEVDAHGYHFIQAERGSEFARMTTQDLDELLYAALSGATSWTAVQYELRHRVVGQDSRRAMFQRQIELLTAVPRPGLTAGRPKSPAFGPSTLWTTWQACVPG